MTLHVLCESPFPSEGICDGGEGGLQPTGSSSTGDLAHAIRTPIDARVRPGSLLRRAAADEQRRYEIYTLIQGLVLQRHRTSPNVLFPFLIHDPARLIVATAALDLVALCPIDFLIDWLEDLQARGDENRFGFVVAALMNPMQTRQIDQVFTGERPIPDWSVNDADRVVHSMSLAAYRKQIGPRLRAIARREADPKIMPMALQSWGV